MWPNMVYELMNCIANGESLDIVMKVSFSLLMPFACFVWRMLYSRELTSRLACIGETSLVV